ncbi:heat shock protein Hsp20 domain-containing protein [Dictyostelium discoideum AX4]|uniref:Heat shock protein Hsp20 domain-containing protein n=1 Tax=Dictyostelium discoideum TaxID=44689 RepID=C7G080_DICDI|nr:heat shock protein Hsp20 domain-containing protein [Dictyostelium discoideum AX4]EEU04040.1 heat shock protein Hsp20 domain-containing protein [Dictyostelium discoideum AX4]|eukprot:XP_002649092.1 heat shock protein Hsp20 domain-containing protein [Dictyostelium discoideum AX4]
MSSSVFNLLFNNNEYVNCNKFNLIKESIQNEKLDLESNQNQKPKIYPLIEINESNDSYIIEVEIPGIPINQIKISIKNFILTLKIFKTNNNNNNNNNDNNNNNNNSKEKYKNIFSDRKFGVFERNINFQKVKDKIIISNITSNLDNGILTLKLNKKKGSPI